MGGQCGQCGQGLQVVADDLGGDILAYGRLEQSADMLQVQAVFEAFEGLLDAPALVVQSPEAKGREALLIEQVGHQDAVGVFQGSCRWPVADFRRNSRCRHTRHRGPASFRDGALR